MPGLEEIEGYIHGVVLLARNRKEGFNRLDISADGFWRSFWAIAYSLPALAVSWASYRTAFLNAAEEGARAGFDFVLRLAFIDIATWIVPIVLFVLVARPLGVERYIARFVIVTNWLGVVTTYALALPAMLQFLPIGTGLAGALFSIAIFIFAVLLLYRVTKISFDGDAMNAAVVTIGTVVVSIMLTGLLQSVLGVAIV